MFSGRDFSDPFVDPSLEWLDFSDKAEPFFFPGDAVRGDLRPCGEPSLLLWVRCFLFSEPPLVLPPARETDDEDVLPDDPRSLLVDNLLLPEEVDVEDDECSLRSFLDL